MSYSAEYQYVLRLWPRHRAKELSPLLRGYFLKRATTLAVEHARAAGQYLTGFKVEYVFQPEKAGWIGLCVFEQSDKSWRPH